jgi:hypothetical protein
MVLYKVQMVGLYNGEENPGFIGSSLVCSTQTLAPYSSP